MVPECRSGRGMNATKDVIMDFAPSGRAVPGKDPWGVELDATAR